MGNIARNSSSLICINKNKILILKRSADDDVQPNLWCFPGGSVDDNESFEIGLKREVLEEIGAYVYDLNFFKSYFIDDNKRFGVRAVYFSGRIESSIKLNEEHSEYYFFDVYKDNLDDFNFAFNQKQVLSEFIEENNFNSNLFYKLKNMFKN